MTPKGTILKRICKYGHDTVGPNARTLKNRCRLCYERRLKENSAKAKIRYTTLTEQIRQKNKCWKGYGIYISKGVFFSTIDYDRAYQIQQGKCKLCGIHNTEFKRNFSVDHDHETGMFRSLLCNKCNLKLGYIEDVVWFNAAMTYLKEK